MLSFEPNVVVIDDKPDEVKGIIDHYREKGIGCKYFNASRTSEDTFPEKTYSDVSLVFLDLYFTESRYDFDAELCVNWIETIIPEKSFYILVIWTREIDHQDEILELLKNKRLTPFKYIIHNKTDFISPNPELEKYNFNDLMLEINAAFDQTPALSEIGFWKKNIKLASNKVIGGLTKDFNPEFFNTKLKKLIIGHGGTSLIRSTDSNRKRKVLFDALDRVLTSNTSELIDYITNPSDQLYNISPADIRGEIDKELNSWFFFKLEKQISQETIMSGLISKFNDSELQKNYSIRDDKKIEPKLSNQKEINGLIISDIVVVMSRPCDIAQDKYGKNIKLLSGIKINNPLRYEEHNLTEKQKKNKNQYLNKLVLTADLPDSCKLYDHLYFSEKETDVVLLFDFRYVFSVPEQVFKDKFDNIKIFNKELISEIQVEYSNYSSRLGITQII